MIIKKIYRGHAFRIAVEITMLVLLFAGAANATTYTVCFSGCEFTSIQAAINDVNTTDGDTIEVHSGTYFENVNVTKQITLRGIEMPVVDAGRSGSAITLASSGIVLEGFTATGAGPTPEAGIKVISSGNTLIGNNVSNNITYSWGVMYSHGIYLVSSSNNTLIGNNAWKNYEGIYLNSSSNNNTLIGNNVSNNDAGGIYLVSSSNNTLIGNNANLNQWSGFCLLLSSNNNTLIGNNANSNNIHDGWGIYISFSSNNTLSGNNVSNNRNTGIYLVSSLNNKIYNNIFNNNNNFYFTDSIINTWNTTKQFGTNIIGGSYFGGNIWANPSGTGFSQTCSNINGDGICDSTYVLDVNNIDYLPLAWLKVHNINKGTNYFTIQSAIDDANTGNEIHVDSGTYFENVNVNKKLILKGMDTGAGKPVVDASGIDSPMRLSADGVTVDGFVTKNISKVCWAGIIVISSNNTLRNNNVLDGCNGIELSNSHNNTLINNTVNSNNYSAIFLHYSNNNTLIGNNASYNKGDYAYGINLQYSNNNTLIGNIASNNTQGVYWNLGISLGYSNNNNITGNVVNSNAFGIFICQSSNNNNLTGNTVNSNTGIGIYVYYSSNNNLTGNTVHSNKGTGNNGTGIHVYYSSNNNLTSNIVNSNNDGIIVTNSSSNILTNNTVNSNNRFGILLSLSGNNNLTNNIVNSNNRTGISISSSNNNTFYNNIFNNANNFYSYGSNIYNTTRQSGINIIGGSHLGGNFWGYPNGTGFSQTCINANSDGICDSPYVLDANNIDYLPLTSINTILPTIRYINGTIKDNSTGYSLSGVTISANSTLSTTSNATGFYSFAVNDGSYNLISRYDIRYYTNTTMVSTIGKAVAEQDIEMIKKPTGNITGNVTRCCTIG
jgi:parallel beta-helix repeat protein